MSISQHEAVSVLRRTIAHAGAVTAGCYDGGEHGCSSEVNGQDRGPRA